ncbi:MAG TPA: EamA family transporter, partial [Puia sp.]|nr:EamA family transporter [Puia sp.]
WCLITKEKIFSWPVMRPAIISGLLLLFFGTGALIWSEQYLASSLAAILLAAGPIWFVLLDRRQWKENFRSRKTIVGLLVGFAGVILLFGEQLSHSLGAAAAGSNAAGAVAPSVAAGSNAANVTTVAPGTNWPMVALVVLVLGSISWAAGSLYSKYKSAGNANTVNAGWQMFAAGAAFIPASLLSGEWSHFHWQEVPLSSWLSIAYLVTMGSLAGYSAFVWLLQVRSATQVSTHAYVNPVVAVLLGVFFADEHMSVLQLAGLVVILISVLLINLAKHKSSAASATSAAPMNKSVVRGTARA